MSEQADSAQDMTAMARPLVVWQKPMRQREPVLDESDIAVLRRLANGDKAALGVLYDRHAPVLLALGLRILRARREAEDLLHDVFLELWRHAGDYQPERGSVKSWMLLRMRSRCLDRVRSHGYSRVVALEAEPGQRDAGGAAELDERRLDGNKLRGLIERLPPGQRDVLALGYFEGLSFSEIATQLGIPIGTVKSRVSAAMQTLRKEMGVDAVNPKEAS
ncbi:MAG TPA: sigma-70 family RNA polymerase sigma factor [Polyangiales bacterium]|nr:sigma-70 family RNA polymerase sigma factor [Polyangiales bacterium]